MSVIKKINVGINLIYFQLLTLSLYAFLLALAGSIIATHNNLYCLLCDA